MIVVKWRRVDYGDVASDLIEGNPYKHFQLRDETKNELSSGNK